MGYVEGFERRDELAQRMRTNACAAAGSKNERTTIGDRHVHVLLPVPDMWCQAFSDREDLQVAVRLPRARQRGGLVQPKGREHLPAGGVQVLAGRTPLAERLDFLSVRLSRDKNDFRSGNEIGRQLRRP